MRDRLPLVLSVTALAVAVFGSTPLGEAAYKAGPQGPMGDRGPKGEKGRKGEKGDKGDPGLSGYEVVRHSVKAPTRPSRCNS